MESSVVEAGASGRRARREYFIIGHPSHVASWPCPHCELWRLYTTVRLYLHEARQVRFGWWCCCNAVGGEQCRCGPRRANWHGGCPYFPLQKHIISFIVLSTRKALSSLFLIRSFSTKRRRSSLYDMTLRSALNDGASESVEWDEVVHWFTHRQLFWYL